MIPPMTPTGAFNVIVVTSPGMPFISVSPVMLAACEAKNHTIFSKEDLVPRSLETGAPMSRASISISSSNLSSRRWPMRVNSAWRSYGVHLRHCPSNAKRAALTSRSTSISSPAASCARASPVDGLTVVSVRPEAAGTRLPSMTSCSASRDKKLRACSHNGTVCSGALTALLSPTCRGRSIEDEDALADLALVEQLVGPLRVAQPELVREERLHIQTALGHEQRALLLLVLAEGE